LIQNVGPDDGVSFACASEQYLVASMLVFRSSVDLAAHRVGGGVLLKPDGIQASTSVSSTVKVSSSW
jgi:hypothetical protein